MDLRGRGDRAHSAADFFLASPWLALAILCGTIVSLGLMWATAGHYGHDFRVLWNAGRSVHPYAADPYGPFAYPPTTLLWLKPFGLLPFRSALALWSCLSLAAFGVVTRRWLLLLSPVVVQCLAFGQTSLLIAALVLFAARRPALLRGVLFGLAFTLKPQMTFLAPLVLVARRDWHGLLGFVVGVALSMFTALALFGFQPWLDWIAALPSFSRVVAARDLYWVMITPYGAAARFGLNPWPFWAAGALLAVAAIRSRADLVSVIVLSSLLATPYAVAHDLAALLPLALVSIEQRKPAWVLIYTAALVPLGLVAIAIGWTLGRDRLSNLDVGDEAVLRVGAVAARDSG